MRYSEKVNSKARLFWLQEEIVTQFQCLCSANIKFYMRRHRESTPFRKHFAGDVNYRLFTHINASNKQ